MNEQPAASRIQVQALADSFQARAEQWASLLGLPLQMADADFSLQVGNTVCSCNSLGLTRQGRCGSTLSKAARRIGDCMVVAAGR